MKIYFGQIPADDVDEFGEDGLVGPDSYGNYYGQYVEIGTNAGELEEVAIGDGCGRMVPICIDTLSDLIAALQYIQDDLSTIKQAKRLKKQLKSDTVKFVEDEVVHVDFEIQKSFVGNGW
jgi:hypothetical protein